MTADVFSPAELRKQSRHDILADMEKHITELRSKIDAADYTTLGDLGKLLDGMATDADALVRVLTRLRDHR